VELATEYTVYRLYDFDSNLLYVGCTKNLMSRLGQHANKEWWSEVARIEKNLFDDPVEAADTEGRYYFAEYSRHNGRKHMRYRAPQKTRPRSGQKAASSGVRPPRPRTPQEEEYWTLKEVAKRLKVNRRTVDRWIEEESLLAYRVA
jgi:hypothetical protein